MAIKRNRIQVMIEDDLCDKLKEAAEKDSRTVSEYLRLMILDYLSD